MQLKQCPVTPCCYLLAPADFHSLESIIAWFLFMAIYEAECPNGDSSDRCPKLTPSTYNWLPPQSLIMSWRLDIIPTFLYHHRLLVCSVSVKLWWCGSKGSHSHKPLLYSIIFPTNPYVSGKGAGNHGIHNSQLFIACQGQDSHKRRERKKERGREKVVPRRRWHPLRDSIRLALVPCAKESTGLLLTPASLLFLDAAPHRFSGGTFESRAFNSNFFLV